MGTKLSVTFLVACHLEHDEDGSITQVRPDKEWLSKRKIEYADGTPWLVLKGE